MLISSSSYIFFSCKLCSNVSVGIIPQIKITKLSSQGSAMTFNQMELTKSKTPQKKPANTQKTQKKNKKSLQAMIVLTFKL